MSLIAAPERAQPRVPIAGALVADLTSVAEGISLHWDQLDSDALGALTDAFTCMAGVGQAVRARFVAGDSPDLQAAVRRELTRLYGALGAAREVLG